MAKRPDSAIANEREFHFSRDDFRRVQRLIGALAGIALLDHKESMVYNRLAARLRANGLSRFRDYLDLVERSPSDELGPFVNALTTNLTSFFREHHHFEYLAEHAAAHLRKSRAHQPLRVWSSACSSGEEPYTSAIVLYESGCPATILATDIDTEVLKKAKRGDYPLEAVENIGPERLRRCFLKGVGVNAGRVRIRPELQAMVTFSERNLQATDWPENEQFDVIFCRNVMIYFSKESQQRILQRFVRVLRPGGLLFVGHSESYASSHPALRNRGKTAYERLAIDFQRVS